LFFGFLLEKDGIISTLITIASISHSIVFDRII